MTGTILTKRWCDRFNRRKEPIRVLVCRYRPRALAKEKETWNVWKASCAMFTGSSNWTVSRAGG